MQPLCGEPPPPGQPHLGRAQADVRRPNALDVCLHPASWQPGGQRVMPFDEVGIGRCRPRIAAAEALSSVSCRSRVGFPFQVRAIPRHGHC